MSHGMRFHTSICTALSGSQTIHVSPEKDLNRALSLSKRLKKCFGKRPKPRAARTNRSASQALTAVFRRRRPVGDARARLRLDAFGKESDHQGAQSRNAQEHENPPSHEDRRKGRLVWQAPGWSPMANWFSQTGLNRWHTWMESLHEIT